MWNCAVCEVCCWSIHNLQNTLRFGHVTSAVKIATRQAHYHLAGVWGKQKSISELESSAITWWWKVVKSRSPDLVVFSSKRHFSGLDKQTKSGAVGFLGMTFLFEPVAFQWARLSAIFVVMFCMRVCGLLVYRSKALVCNPPPFQKPVVMFGYGSGGPNQTIVLVGAKQRNWLLHYPPPSLPQSQVQWFLAGSPGLFVGTMRVVSTMPAVWSRGLVDLWSLLALTTIPRLESRLVVTSRADIGLPLCGCPEAVWMDVVRRLPPPQTHTQRKIVTWTLCQNPWQDIVCRTLGWTLSRKISTWTLSMVSLARHYLQNPHPNPTPTPGKFLTWTLSVVPSADVFWLK